MSGRRYASCLSSICAGLVFVLLVLRTALVLFVSWLAGWLPITFRNRRPCRLQLSRLELELELEIPGQCLVASGTPTCQGLVSFPLQLAGVAGLRLWRVPGCGGGCLDYGGDPLGSYLL